jgi:hypothetical protein
MNNLEHADRDVLDKIIEAMQLYSIEAEEMTMLRAKIPPVGSSLDEPWEKREIVVVALDSFFCVVLRVGGV